MSLDPWKTIFKRSASGPTPARISEFSNSAARPTSHLALNLNAVLILVLPLTSLTYDSARRNTTLVLQTYRSRVEITSTVWMYSGSPRIPCLACPTHLSRGVIDAGQQRQSRVASVTQLCRSTPKIGLHRLCLLPSLRNHFVDLDRKLLHPWSAPPPSRYAPRHCSSPITTI